MITLFIECALRPQELLGLKWKDIKINEDVGELKVYSNKVKETRIIPFKTSILHILRWKDEYQFVDRREEKRIWSFQIQVIETINYVGLTFLIYLEDYVIEQE